MKSNSHKLKHGKLDSRGEKKKIIMQMTKEENGLCKETVESPALQTFKTQLDQPLNIFIYNMTYFKQGCVLDDLQRSFLTYFFQLSYKSLYKAFSYYYPSFSFILFSQIFLIGNGNTVSCVRGNSDQLCSPNLKNSIQVFFYYFAEICSDIPC